MYKLFQSKTPTYLADRYIANTSTRPVRGYCLLLKSPPFTKEFLENSFYVTSSYLCGTLYHQRSDTVPHCILSRKSCLSFFYHLNINQGPLWGLICKKFFKIFVYYSSSYLQWHLRQDRKEGMCHFRLGYEEKFILAAKQKSLLVWKRYLFLLKAIFL